MSEKRKGYPSDVSDEEWNFCVNYLTLMKEDAPQREHSLRSVFNALRYLIRVGGAWRMLPNDLPPWKVVLKSLRTSTRSRANSRRYRFLALSMLRLSSYL
jgi:transposase